MPETFQLFTSLRHDSALLNIPEKGPECAGWNRTHKSPFYMLDFHRDRILRAATHWNWPSAVGALKGDAGLSRLASAIESSIGTDAPALRVKVLLSRDGQLTCETSPVPAQPLQNLFPARLPPPGAGPAEDDPLKTQPMFDVVPDKVPTASSAYTHFKTTERAMYDGARGRAGIGLTDRKETLLVNRDDGSVMEGSLRTPWFWRGGRWVTPPVSAEYGPGLGSGGQDGTTRRWALERGLAVEDVVRVDNLVDGEECWVSNGVGGFVCGRIRLGT